MWKRFDESESIASLIEGMSNALAQQRGLLPLIGIGLVGIGLVILLINAFVSVALLEFAGLLLQGLGIILALVGLLLIEPLGG